MTAELSELGKQVVASYYEELKRLVAADKLNPDHVAGVLWSRAYEVAVLFNHRRHANKYLPKDAPRPVYEFLPLSAAQRAAALASRKNIERDLQIALARIQGRTYHDIGKQYGLATARARDVAKQVSHRVSNRGWDSVTQCPWIEVYGHDVPELPSASEAAALRK